MKKKHTSLIIKDHVIRFVTMKRSSLHHIQAFGEHILPKNIVADGKIVDDEAFQLILGECVRKWKLKNQTVSFCVPDNSVIIRTISDIPPQLQQYDEIKQYLSLVIGETIHLPFDDPAFDFYETNNAQEIVLIAAPQESIRPIQAALEKVKLKPVVADLTSLSVYRLYYLAEQIENDENILLAQFDMHALNVTIFQRHQPVFTRYISLKIDEYNETEKETVRQFDELVTEIERLMDFYRYSMQRGEQQITKIIAAGDHQHILKFVEKLKTAITVPLLSLQQEFSTISGEAVPPRYYDVLGLALKQEG